MYHKRATISRLIALIDDYWLSRKSLVEGSPNKVFVFSVVCGQILVLSTSAGTLAFPAGNNIDSVKCYKLFIK